MRAKLDDICKRIYAGGDVPKDRYSEQKTDQFTIPIYANAEKNDGLYGYTDKARETELCITVAARGTIGYTSIRKEPFLPVVRLIVVVPDTTVISVNYLYYILKGLKPQSTGTSIPQLTVPDIKKRSIELYTLPEQETIAKKLSAIERLIKELKKELILFDDLIKARFVEMFGDPVYNSAKLQVLPMTEVCTIIDGDRGSNYPKQEDFYDDEYCLFLNAKNVTNHGFDFSSCMFITEEKDKSLRKGKLKRGDIVLTTRGTLGNLAFYTDDIPYENIRINSGMVILRMNKELIDEGFFIAQFRMQIEEIKKSIASGSAQPQLPISTMNKIGVVMPDLIQQKRFSSFVSQIDKSKFTVQKALEEAQLLFDSLMQKYFG